MSEPDLQDLLAPLRDEPEPASRRLQVDRERIVSRMVEASLAPNERASSRVRWYGALALAAGVALAVWGGSSWWRSRAGAPPFVEVTALRGNVRGALGALGVGQTLQISPEGWLETAPGAEARIKTGGGLELDLLEDTKVSLAELGAGRAAAALKLERGRVRCVIQHRPERTFAVVTPSARVTDVGTVFNVSVAPGAAGATTTVHVEEGAVLVEYAGGQRRLGATQSWSSAPLVPPVAAAPPSVSAGRLEPQPAPSQRREPSKRRTPTLALETELLQSGLRSEQQGDLRAAVSAFEALVARYPGSPLAPDAKAALLRVRSRLGSSK